MEMVELSYDYIEFFRGEFNRLIEEIKEIKKEIGEFRKDLDFKE